MEKKKIPPPVLCSIEWKRERELINYARKQEGRRVIWYPNTDPEKAE